MHRSIVVTAPNAGRRVDAFLKRELADIPRGAMMKWIRTGLIRVNGKRTKGEARLAEGDEIRVPMDDPSRSDHAPTRPAPARAKLPGLAIIYEDADILVVDKPAHLPAHAGTGHERDSLEARVSAYLNAEHAPVGHKPGLAQRLDSGVSGLVPIGKHAGALRVFAKAVSDDRLRKIYRAIVLGTPSKDNDDIRIPLRVDDQRMGNKPRTHPDANGQSAHSTYTVIEKLQGVTIVDVEIHTGRTHQIRAHMRAIGHPLLGDPRYGNPDKERALELGTRLGRPALHARRLEFAHPISNKMIVADAPLPKDLEKILAELRRR
jgi:RluA family pseudouridine synthase